MDTWGDSEEDEAHEEGVCELDLVEDGEFKTGETAEVEGEIAGGVQELDVEIIGVSNGGRPI